MCLQSRLYDGVFCFPGIVDPDYKLISLYPKITGDKYGTIIDDVDAHSLKIWFIV